MAWHNRKWRGQPVEHRRHAGPALSRITTRIIKIDEGTSEVQRMLITRELRVGD
jgi:alkylation response protein AidB-like acyl-CoA dehydrogenase